MWFSLKTIPPQGTLGNAWVTFGCRGCGSAATGGSPGEWRPGLLNSLRAQDSPTAKNCPEHNSNSAKAEQRQSSMQSFSKRLLSSLCNQDYSESQGSRRTAKNILWGRYEITKSSYVIKSTAGQDHRGCPVGKVVVKQGDHERPHGEGGI